MAIWDGQRILGEEKDQVQEGKREEEQAAGNL